MAAIAGALLASSLGACRDAGGVPPPVAAPEVAVREVGSAASAAAESAAVHVAVDVGDENEASKIRSLLEAAGFVVDDQAETRVSIPAGNGLPTGNATVVPIEAYALVVHPRAPLYDLTQEEVSALLTGTQEGGATAFELVADESALPWLNRAFPVANRFVRLAATAPLLDEVAGGQSIIGLVPAAALDRRVRALTVDGHDPYRDPWSASPFVDARAVTGPNAESVTAALGRTERALADPVGFLATGELIPARCVTARMADLEGGYDVIFDGTRDLIGAADLAMAHWEPAIVDDTPTPCTPTFNMSTLPEAAHAADRAGIDVALAVGNHVGDCWTGCSYIAAVQQTVDHLHDAGLVVAGAGDTLDEARQPALVTVDGITFAFLGYDEIAWAHYGARAGTPGTAHADLDGLADDVRAAAELANHVIVGFSWGVEYVAEPSSQQREAARTAIKAGASLVVGNHPHWVQATEWIGDGFVAYGLGNFIFDQDWSVETTQGAVLEVGFTADRILGVRLRPTAIRQQHLVELLDPAAGEGAVILDQIWRATDVIAR